MLPVGMTNASTTKERKINARINAIISDSSVSLTIGSALLWRDIFFTSGIF